MVASLCVFCRRPVDAARVLMVYDTINLREPRYLLCSWTCCGRWAEMLAGELQQPRAATPAPSQSALF